MKKFKNEKEIKEYFGSEMLGFQIMCDGVAEYKTLRPIDTGVDYVDFKITFFPEEKPFFNYDSLDNLLGDMQIFEVIAIDALGGKKELYHCKFIDYRNN